MKLIITLTHAFIGWMVCGAIIGVGRAVTTLQTTLVVHAIGAPVVFGLLAWNFQKRFHYYSPLSTAALFTFFTVAMDALVVAPFMEKSYAMFTSVFGTWLPLFLIFATTYFTSAIIRGRTKVIT